VGLLSLLWNGFGCLDYTLTNLRDPAYIAQFPPEMIDYLDSFPGWAVVAWGLGVGAGALGSLLLLARSIWAAYAFAFSFLGLALTTFYQFSEGMPASMNTPMNWGMTGAIWIVCIGLLLYALRMRSRGVLR